LDDPDTKKREIKGLLQVCKLFELKHGFIISYDNFEYFEVDGINIQVIPSADFLLGDLTVF
jgi:predicted AAA+ superfamily ATPase